MTGSNTTQGRCRIVLTGGPGGGKTTALDLFRREVGDRVVIVPEAATMLWTGGFPRGDVVKARRASQRAIYHVQRNLEDAQAAIYPNRILLCDRGTLDGVVYWPNSDEDFFEAMSTTLEHELARYDAVIFFRSAALGGLGIEGGNPTRTEDLQLAAELDHRLLAVWSQHPNLFVVPHNPSFFKKVTFGLAALESLVTQHEAHGRIGRPLPNLPLDDPDEPSVTTR